VTRAGAAVWNITIHSDKHSTITTVTKQYNTLHFTGTQYQRAVVSSDKSKDSKMF